MKHRIEVVVSYRQVMKYREKYVQRRLMEEAKRMIGDELSTNLVFSKNEGNFHTTHFTHLYTLTQEQVDHIESMLSLAPTIRNDIMDEILNK